MDKKKRKRKTFSRLTIGSMFFATLFVSGMFVLGAANEVITYFKLKSEVSANSELLDKTRQEQEQLENTKKNLTNPDYLEFVARGKYHVSRSGEQVFVFPSLQEGEQESEAEADAAQSASDQPAPESTPAQ